MNFQILLRSVIFAAALAGSVHAEETVFTGFQVYETESARLGGNDTKPRLFAVKLTAKDDALWVEGSDYNYEWLTLIPYQDVTGLTLNRSRHNPYDEGTKGGWLGRQLAKATDVKSWFAIDFTDRKGATRRATLLAAFRADADFLRTLEVKTGRKAVLEGETPGEAPSEAGKAPALPGDSPALALKAPPAPVRLMDLMTVSEFRACGLAKLSDEELAQLDAWLTHYVAGR